MQIMPTCACTMAHVLTETQRQRVGETERERGARHITAMRQTDRERSEGDVQRNGRSTDR